MRLVYSLALSSIGVNAITHFSEANLAGFDNFSDKKKEHIGLIETIVQLFENCQDYADCQLVIDNAVKKVEAENFHEDDQTTLLITAIEELQKRQKRVNTGSMRALLKTDMGLLDEYACWCYFEGDVGMGAGQPVDAIDEFCRTLQKGYECIIMDHAETGDNGVDPDCIPWAEEVNSAFGTGVNPWGLNMENIVNECQIQNPGEHSCARKVCIVEGYFVMQYFNYAIFGGTIDRDLQHEQGFNKDQQCLKTGGGVPTSPVGGAHGGGGGGQPQPTPGGVYQDCCGDYPFRAPYWHKADHQCCNNLNLYDATQVFCCSNGSIEASELNCPG